MKICGMLEIPEPSCCSWALPMGGVSWGCSQEPGLPGAEQRTGLFSVLAILRAGSHGRFPHVCLGVRVGLCGHRSWCSIRGLCREGPRVKVIQICVCRGLSQCWAQGWWFVELLKQGDEAECSGGFP